MRKSIVACAGGANIDVQGFSNAPVNMRDSNPGVVRLCPGGVGRNIAENLARLGADVRMVSAVGDDPFGEIILKSCIDAGMDISHIEILPDARSSSYLVLTDSDGDMLAAVSDMHILKDMKADFILRHAEAFDSADARRKCCSGLRAGDARRRSDFSRADPGAGRAPGCFFYFQYRHPENF